jgi:hypothetical protein
MMAFLFDRQKDKYRQGISTQQGTNGVTQGGQGWKSQYGGQENSIINRLTSSAPKFQAPEITKSLLTNEGFNQALGVVQARNNAKLEMMNRRNLSGVLGSLLGNDTRRYGIDTQARTQQGIAALNAKTRMRGQDLNYQVKNKALDETSAYHNIMKDYYNGQLTNQQARLQLERQKINAPKQVNPFDEQYKRARIVKTAGGIGAIVGDPHFDDLPDEQKQRVTAEYIRTGRLPTKIKPQRDVPFVPHFLETNNAEPVYDDRGQQQAEIAAQQYQTRQQGASLGTKERNQILKTIADQYGFDLSDLHFEGNTVVTPRGKYDATQLWERINGNP